MEKNQNLAVGIVLVMLLLGGMVLLARRPMQPAPIFTQPTGEVKKFQITEQEPEGRGVHQYVNEETWDIERDADGLAKRVTIHRKAEQR